MADNNLRALLHTPEELAEAHVAWAERLQDGQGTRFGIPALDNSVIPMRPGDLVTFIARPGHGKTSLMAYLARYHAARIQEAGNADTEAVVYVTWEQSAEELEAFFQADTRWSISDIMWGRAPLEHLRQKAQQRAGLPIWIIGYSITKEVSARPPRMTPDVVLRAIELMQDEFGVHPALLLFDYLQKIPVPRARDRVQQVSELPGLIQEVGTRVRAPAVAGVQASREVDKREWKLPEMADCQWASAIEQDSDKMFGLWRPWLTEPPGSFIPLPDGKRLKITPEMLIIGMCKQRGDQGRGLWVMHFEPQYLRLAEMELRTPGG